MEKNYKSHSKPRKKERFNPQVIVAIIGAFTTICAALFGTPAVQQLLGVSPTPTATARIITATPQPSNTPSPIKTPDVVSVTPNAQTLYDQVTQLRIDVDRLQSNSGNTQLERDVKNLGARLGTIEEVILENPGKALQVAALRNDVDKISSQLTTAQDDINSMRGFYYTIVASVILLAITTALSSWVKPKNEARDSGLSDVKEQIRQLNIQIEKIAQQNAKPQEIGLSELKEQIRQLNVQLEKLTQQDNKKQDSKDVEQP